MNILWLSNIVLPEYISPDGKCLRGTGGWMHGLIGAIRCFAPDIHLSVAFASNEVAIREVRGVVYYGLGCVNDFKYAARLKRCLHLANPDVIHIHGTEMIAQTLPDFVYDYAPTILSIQGIVDACGRNYMGGISKEDLVPFRSLMRKFFRRLAPWDVANNFLSVRAKKEHDICCRVKNFIGRTEFDYAWISSINSSAHYFHVDEVLRSEFYEPTGITKHRKKYQIYVGAAFSYPLKGGHILIDSVEIIRKKYPNVMIYVAASSRCQPKSFFEKIKQDEYSRYLWWKIKTKGLENNFVMLPTLSASEVRSVLEESAVFCLPSTMENSPNSLCEAQLTKTPVVAFSVGGIPTFVKSEETGLLVQRILAKDLAAACIRMLKDDVLCAHCSNAAYETALIRHGAQKVVADLLTAYQESIK